MRSLHLTDPPQPLLIEKDTAKPGPGPGEVLIRVFAAGITPTEVLWYPTSHTKSGAARINAIPSHEFSGEIAEIGEGVEGVSVGQEVYGMNDWFDEGALAEYCLARPKWIASKPGTLNHAESASVPISALTAWQGLFTRANLQPGERILIHGGAGAVGLYAVQLARSRGAHVLTTVSAKDLQLARDLGANEALDYRADRFEEKLSNLDVVFDTVGGTTLERSWGVLKPKGRLVTIAAPDNEPLDARTQEAFFIVEANHQQLTGIANQIDTGKLRAMVGAILPFSQAAIAFTGKMKSDRPGKIVATITQHD